ncbi:MAG: hypothetical protein ACK5NG_09290 [Chthoniobacterales bacterium]
MKRPFFYILSMLIGTVPIAYSLTQVPRNYPKQDSPPPQLAKNEDQLMGIVTAIYQNDVVLLANDPKRHEVLLKDIKVKSDSKEQVRLDAGTPPTLASTTAAVGKILRANPKQAIDTTAAAFSLLGPSGLNVSPQSQVSVAASAIQSINGKGSNYLDNLAIIIGLAVERLPEKKIASTIRQLRSLAISQIPEKRRIDYTFALDKALEEYRVVVQQNSVEKFGAASRDFKGADDFKGLDFKGQDFKGLAGDFLPDPQEEPTIIPYPLLLSPFGTGGQTPYDNPGFVIDEITETPPPSPTPTPTPTPSPTPTPLPTLTPPS